AAVHTDQLARNLQSKSSAAFLPCTGIVNLLELLKYCCLIFKCDPRPGVTYHNIEFPIDCLDAHFNLAGISEFYGVAHEIQEYLSKTAFVASAHRKVIRYAGLDFDSLRLCKRTC